MALDQSGQVVSTLDLRHLTMDRPRHPPPDLTLNTNHKCLDFHLRIVTSLGAKYDELYGTLRSKYGTPHEDRETMTPDCARDVKACVVTGKAPRGSVWKWPDGFRIEVRLTVSSANAMIELRYLNPAAAQQLTPGPAL
jgi:hypothetical protein